MEWLIPAHAGKTRRAPRGSCRRTAHPRSRGENQRGLTSGHIVTGSSPLTRGKPPYRSWWGASLLAHPRSRGENPRGVEAHVPSSGSSPLTRGKQSSRKPPEIVIGLIPAHAGKTPRRGRLRRACPAHPRSRGENADSIRSISPVGGSSPLTRGKRNCQGRRC